MYEAEERRLREALAVQKRKHEACEKHYISCSLTLYHLLNAVEKCSAILN